MTNTIRETITAALNAGGSLPYGAQRYVDSVVSALEAREQEVGQDLVDFAITQGLDEDSAVEAVQESGLGYVKPEPVVEEAAQPVLGGVTLQDLAPYLRRLEAVERAAESARRSGLI